MKKTDTSLNKKAVSVVAAGALALSLTPAIAFADADEASQGGAAAQQANAAASAEDSSADPAAGESVDSAGDANDTFDVKVAPQAEAAAAAATAAEPEAAKAGAEVAEFNGTKYASFDEALADVMPKTRTAQPLSSLSMPKPLVLTLITTLLSMAMAML